MRLSMVQAGRHEEAIYGADREARGGRNGAGTRRQGFRGRVSRRHSAVPVPLLSESA
jgi:hypothetical protein